jgi:hypothetical protein
MWTAFARKAALPASTPSLDAIQKDTEPFIWPVLLENLHLLALFAIREYNIKQEMSPMLKPQDILVLLRIVGEPATWSFQELSHDLGMSASEVHQALKRAEVSRLYDAKKRRVMKHSLLEFAVHGIPYAFPAIRQARCYGIPTAHSADPLRSKLIADLDDCLVWPDPDGNQFGDAIEPLYRSAPKAASRNPALHRRLALVDALRVGGAREREMAAKALNEEFGT